MAIVNQGLHVMKVVGGANSSWIDDYENLEVPIKIVLVADYNGDSYVILKTFKDTEDVNINGMKTLAITTGNIGAGNLPWFSNASTADAAAALTNGDVRLFRDLLHSLRITHNVA